ncbi:unnamed protein product [Sphagnum jensenii]|uniref:ATP phosphoribosyltransferase n=1 Tax=Sphagnum jensenii TaxID=128206 RepID=A0ABP1BIT2_9BRYO
MASSCHQVMLQAGVATTQLALLSSSFHSTSSSSSSSASYLGSKLCCNKASSSLLLRNCNSRMVRRDVERETVRMALPSKGRMAEDTLALLQECELSVRKLNPRQYIADISELKNVEVWFQRASDVVRKLRSGDVDMGIVGYDMVREYGEDDEDLIIIHDALGFGECHLGIGIPTYGIFENISSLSQLAAMPQWTEDRPLRVVTGYTYLGEKFFQEKGLKHVQLSTADGALEAAPAMGTADAILDLVSSGTTLRENNLKEINGGAVLSSQGVFVANKRALLERKEVLDVAHELLERFEAHLTAQGQFTVVANMRGSSAEEVAERILEHTDFPGLQGPTISPVYTTKNGNISVDYYAIVICVPKPKLYHAIRQLRKAGGSGVLVSPLTYIFDEETPRYRNLLAALKS